jgi:hypothetical protein
MVSTSSGGLADKTDKAAASCLTGFTPKDSGQFCRATLRIETQKPQLGK